MRSPSRGVRVVLGALLIGALAAPAVGSVPADPGSAPAARTAAAAPQVLHRVVWDHHRRGVTGIHLRSANLDGTDVRRIYDLPRGFTTQLTPDNEGRRVAFATCCSDRFPQLVVVPVRGGEPLEPLARHPQLIAIGGIGWSPDGRRLAFEAISVRGDDRVYGIWTVRPNGRGLRRVITLSGFDRSGQPVINDALAWTRRGILYSDGRNLRSARSGRSWLVLRHVFSVRISGDHRHLVVDRRRGDRVSTWTTDPDGGHARRVLIHGQSGEGPTYDDITPNHDGSALLARRSIPGSYGSDDAVVTWPVTESPSDATELTVAAGHSPVTWS